MLQSIRSGLGSIVVKALFVLLIASFAVWGVGDIFGGAPAGRAAVEVEDVRVSVQEVADEFDRQRQRLGPQVDARIAIQIGVLDRVLQQFTTEALLEVESDHLGLGIGQESIGRYIRDQFTDDLGSFNRAAYESFLFSTRQTEGQFVERLSGELIRNQLLGALIADQTVPSAVVDTLFDYRETRRKAKVLTIRPDLLPAPDAPSAADLAAFYEARKEDYREPEYRSLTWVEVVPAAVAQQIEIADEDVRAAYDEQITRFTTQGTRTVEQMFFADQAAAQAAYDRVQGGEDFFAVAQDAASMDQAATQLGTLTRLDLPEGTQDAVFALNAGEVGAPVESDLGWHVFRVTEATPDVVVSFDDAKQTVRDELALDQAVDIVFETANELEDNLAGGATLEEAGAALNLPVASTPALARNGQGPDGAPIEKMPGGNFLELAFETETGRQSVLGEAGNGFFVLRVDGVDPARIPELSEIQDAVTADWTADKRREQAEDLADEVAQAIRDGASPAFLAASRRLRLSETAAITRSGDGLTEGYPRTLAAALFDIEAIGGVSVASGDDAVHVAQLISEEAPEAEGADQIKEQIRDQIARGLRADTIDLLLTDLSNRYEVETDRNAVISVFATSDQNM